MTIWKYGNFEKWKNGTLEKHWIGLGWLVTHTLCIELGRALVQLGWCITATWY